MKGRNEMCNHYSYAIYQPYGIIMDTVGDELHRFTSPVGRDAWVNDDPVHRKVVYRTRSAGRAYVNPLFKVFNHAERNQIWRSVDGHEVFVGIRSHVDERPAPMPPTSDVVVRGNGSIKRSTVTAGGESHGVMWITTPHDTVVLVGETAAVFAGTLQEEEYEGFVRAMLADSKYDRLVERDLWRQYHDSIKFGLSLAA